MLRMMMMWSHQSSAVLVITHMWGIVWLPSGDNKQRKLRGKKNIATEIRWKCRLLRRCRENSLFDFSVWTRSRQWAAATPAKMNHTDCQLDLPPLIGPVQVYASLGHWNTAVLVILGLHLLPVWAVASTLLYRSVGYIYSLDISETIKTNFSVLNFIVYF